MRYCIYKYIYIFFKKHIFSCFLLFSLCYKENLSNTHFPGSLKLFSKGREALNQIEKAYVNNTIFFPSSLFKHKFYIFSYFNTKAYICRLHLNPIWTNGGLKTNGFAQQTQPQHTTNNTTNTTTMVPTARRLPAASILKVSKIPIRCAIEYNLSNTAMLFFM
jgi:hypothetical protein